jgi:3-oxoacid CoA-transferase subunit A
VDKTLTDADAAVAAISDDSRVAVGGFGLCGVPWILIQALHARGTTGLSVVSNNCGVDDWGLGILLADRRIARVTGSYVGDNSEFARQFLSGELEVELIPQGTLAERLRAGGAGIPAFYTATGVGTQVAEGGLPLRYGPDRNPSLISPPKPTARFDSLGEPGTYVLEEAITCDFALVRARRGDRHGNLVFHRSARNFNPLCAMAGRVTVAEVEELVEPGELDPDEIHLPGIYVDHVLPVGSQVEKRIERRTVVTVPSAGGDR